MTKIDQIKQRIGDAQRALADLESRRAELTRESKEAVNGGPADDFVEFVSTGTVVDAARSAAQIEAELAHVDAMIAAGEARVAGLRRQIVETERTEQAARVAAMTMPDAVQFARGVLQQIDLVAKRAEIERIEQEIEALDAPRIAARDTHGRASMIEHNLAMRYRGSPDPKSGLRSEDARAETASALKRVNDLRDRMRSLQRLHEQSREELTSEVMQATVHIGRLATIAAKAAEEHAVAITTFARAISHDRPSFRYLPAAPAAMALPSRAEITELKSLAEPVLALARRAPPPGRPDHEYLPRSIR